jgi:hypothetical protein
VALGVRLEHRAHPGLEGAYWQVAYYMPLRLVRTRDVLNPNTRLQLPATNAQLMRDVLAAAPDAPVSRRRVGPSDRRQAVAPIR